MARNIFAPDEILKLAVMIEENGERFYSKMSDKVGEQDLKELLLFLAQEEVKHKEVFQKMLEELDETQVVETYPGEYQAYLGALAEECVFTQNLVKERTNSGFENAVDLVEFALKIEKDSIVLYLEMKENILRGEETLERVVAEERKHYLMLSEMREKYKSGKERV